MVSFEDDSFKMMPPIFQADDYKNCKEKAGKYCELEIELSKSTSTENSLLWGTIEQTKNNLYLYDHSQLFYRKCIIEENNIDKLLNKFENLGLNATIKNMDCQEPARFSFNLYDVLFVFGVTCYLLLVIYATFSHVFSKNQQKKELSKFYKSLSLKHNLVQLLDYKKITGTTKPIQGLRVFITFSVVQMHCIFFLFSAFIQNTEDMENLFSNPIMIRMAVVAYHLIQPFLVISTFLLSIQVHKIYEEHKKFTLKQLFILILNRYFRIMGVVTFFIMLAACNFLMVYLSEGQSSLVYRQIKACRTNWMKTFFLVNNYGPDEKCHPGSWYVSADTQLYIVTLFIMYIIMKFKLNFGKVLGVCAAIAYFWHGYIIYANKYPSAMNSRPNYRFMEKTFKLDIYTYMYTSALSSFLTSLVGVYLGRLHFNKVQNKIFGSSKNRKIWWSLAFVAFYLSLELGTRDFGRFGNALIGSLLKGLFGLGFGMIMFGIMHDSAISGPVRIILENRVMLIISSVTFCIYNFHFLIVFSRQYPKPEYFSYLNISKFYLQDLITSLFIAVPGYLLIESPLYNLQKTYLPQVSTKKEKTDKPE